MKRPTRLFQWSISVHGNKYWLSQIFLDITCNSWSLCMSRREKASPRRGKQRRKVDSNKLYPLTCRKDEKQQTVCFPKITQVDPRMWLTCTLWLCLKPKGSSTRSWKKQEKPVLSFVPKFWCVTGWNTLTFIVGKGLHSKDGIAKIKPAVVKILDKEKVNYVIDKFVAM